MSKLPRPHDVVGFGATGHFLKIAVDVVLASLLILILDARASAVSFEDLIDLASSAQQQAQWSVAAEYYLKARELQPLNSQVMRNLGVAYAKQGSPTLAVIWLHAALAAEPQTGDREIIQKEISNEIVHLITMVRRMRNQAVRLASPGDVAIIGALAQLAGNQVDALDIVEDGAYKTASIAEHRYGAEAAEVYKEIAFGLAELGNPLAAEDMAQKALGLNSERTPSSNKERLKEAFEEDKETGENPFLEVLKRGRPKPFGIKVSYKVEADYPQAEHIHKINIWLRQKDVSGAIQIAKQSDSYRQTLEGLVHIALHHWPIKLRGRPVLDAWGWALIQPCELGGWLLLAGVSGLSTCPFDADEMVLPLPAGKYNQTLHSQWTELTYTRQTLVVQDPEGFVREVATMKSEDAAPSLIRGAADLAWMVGVILEMERLWREMTSLQ